MKLETQVCSLELARKLKYLGVKQESYFVIRDDGNKIWHPRDYNEYQYDLEIAYAAFTVAELLHLIGKPITVPADDAADYLAEELIRMYENRGN